MHESTRSAKRIPNQLSNVYSINYSYHKSWKKNKNENENKVSLNTFFKKITNIREYGIMDMRLR